MLVSILVTAVLGASSVHAHGTMTEIKGANGVVANGFGIDTSTPRNGATPKPFEQDTSVIRDNEIASGKTGVCGRTPGAGNNDVATQLAAASSAGLPTCDQSGNIQMTIHQVNQDGAGPYSCDVSGDGGNTFQAATVTKDVPGFSGFSAAAAKDFPLEATMPAGMQCSGGPNGNACIVRCRDASPAGPFGSCAAFTTPAQDGAAGNTTAPAAAAAPAAAPAAAAKPAPAAAAKPAPAAAKPAPAAAQAAPAADGAGAGGIGGALAGILGGAGNAGGAGDAVAGILGGLGKRAEEKKRVILSRVAGPKAGYWI